MMRGSSTTSVDSRLRRLRAREAGPVGEAGFSLLELLVASACTTLIGAAIFALLIGAADTSRREWGALAARRTASAAVAAPAADLARAGTGLEGADAVQLDGARIEFTSSPAPDELRVVLSVAPPIEIALHEPGSRYVLDGSAGLQVGDLVAAVGLPDRPPGAALPVGTVAALAPRGAGTEVQVAWRPAEATVVSAWGAARALVPVSVRSYETRPLDGALQLVRRDDGGSRQPVADELESFRVVWLIDGDADGLADTERPGIWSGPGMQRCAVRLEAVALPARTAQATVLARAAAPERAIRWVTLAGC